MQPLPVETERYAKCIEISKKVRWDIDKDVIRGREFDFSKKFLPDGISKIDKLDFLNKDEQRFLSQVQGRTYANMFGFVERFIVGQISGRFSRNHWLGDQVALEALVRFCDEELKHEELFRRIEKMIDPGMPPGYIFRWNPNEVAAAVLSKSTWAVLGLIYEIELFTQTHYKESIEPDEICPNCIRICFSFTGKRKSPTPLWTNENPIEDQKLTPAEREHAVTELIELVSDVDGILQSQTAADVEYFSRNCRRSFREEEITKILTEVLAAYRWQSHSFRNDAPQFYCTSE